LCARARVVCVCVFVCVLSVWVRLQHTHTPDAAVAVACYVRAAGGSAGGGAHVGRSRRSVVYLLAHTQHSVRAAVRGAPLVHVLEGNTRDAERLLSGSAHPFCLEVCRTPTLNNALTVQGSTRPQQYARMHAPANPPM
jgi:hypothetical protein